MNIKPIKSEKAYTEALAEIEKLFDAKPNTVDGDRLEVLTILVEAYETKHHKIDFPDPVAALEYWMESRGLNRKDLEVYLGTRARVSEILNRKRQLTLAMIHRLHAYLDIPAEWLLKCMRKPPKLRALHLKNKAPTLHVKNTGRHTSPSRNTQW